MKCIMKLLSTIFRAKFCLRFDEAIGVRKGVIPWWYDAEDLQAITPQSLQHIWLTRSQEAEAAEIYSR